MSRGFRRVFIANGPTVTDLPFGVSLFGGIAPSGQGPPGPTGPAGPPGPPGPAGTGGGGTVDLATSSIGDLGDISPGASTAVDGTILVRDSGSGMWVVSGETRLAFGSGTNDSLTTATSSVAIGFNSTGNAHTLGALSAGAIALGSGASATTGTATDNSNSVAIGTSAGNFSQSARAIALGYQAGMTSQAADSIAVGSQAASTASSSIAIGNLASASGIDSVVLGKSASTTGINSIVIGNSAQNNFPGAIVFNATGSTLSATQASSLFVDPIRKDTTSTTVYLKYNETTKEIVRTLDTAPGSLLTTTQLPLTAITDDFPNAGITGGSNFNMVVTAGELTATTTLFNNLAIINTPVVDSTYAEFFVSTGSVPADAIHIYTGIVDSVFFSGTADVANWASGQDVTGNFGCLAGLNLSGGTTRVNHNFVNSIEALNVNAGAITMNTGARIQVGVLGNDIEVVFVQSDLTTVLARLKFTSVSGFGTLDDKRFAIAINSTTIGMSASTNALTFKGTLTPLANANSSLILLANPKTTSTGTYTLKFDSTTNEIVKAVGGGMGASYMYELGDVDPTVQLAESGTVLVRNAAADTWEKSGLTRLALGNGTDNTLTTATSSIAVGFGSTGDAHSLGASSAGAIAIGSGAGVTVVAVTDNTNAIAIGTGAGEVDQAANAIAIGSAAGALDQAVDSIAIGSAANSTGVSSVALGAGTNVNNIGTVAINAGGEFYTNADNATFLNPVRKSTSELTFYMKYDVASKEVVRDANTFHPVVAGPALVLQDIQNVYNNAAITVNNNNVVDGNMTLTGGAYNNLSILDVPVVDNVYFELTVSSGAIDELDAHVYIGLVDKVVYQARTDILGWGRHIATFADFGFSGGINMAGGILDIRYNNTTSSQPLNVDTNTQLETGARIQVGISGNNIEIVFIQNDLTTIVARALYISASGFDLTTNEKYACVSINKITFALNASVSSLAYQGTLTGLSDLNQLTVLTNAIPRTVAGDYTLQLNSTTGEIVKVLSSSTGVQNLHQLDDADPALLTAERGTIIVRDATGTIWEKTGQSRIAIGNTTDNTLTAAGTIAVGFTGAGNAHSLGASSGGAIAIGAGAASDAGTSTSNVNSIAIGTNAGQLSQGSNAIAIGSSAAATTQGNDSVAIGSGSNSTAVASVAIGKFASAINTGAIVLNASGSAFASDASGLFINPVRQDVTSDTVFVKYNPTSKEIIVDDTAYAGTVIDAAHIVNPGLVAIESVYPNPTALTYNATVTSGVLSCSSNNFNGIAIADVVPVDNMYVDFKVESGTVLASGPKIYVGLIDVDFFNNNAIANNLDWASSLAVSSNNGVFAAINVNTGVMHVRYNNTSSDPALVSYFPQSLSVGYIVQLGIYGNSIDIRFMEPSGTSYAYGTFTSGSGFGPLSSKRIAIAINSTAFTMSINPTQGNYFGAAVAPVVYDIGTHDHVRLNYPPENVTGDYTLSYKTSTKSIVMGETYDNIYKMQDADPALSTAEQGTIMVRNATGTKWEKTGLSRIAFGNGTDNTLIADHTIAIGVDAGDAQKWDASSQSSIAIGFSAMASAGTSTNNSFSIAVGSHAGEIGQANSAVSIGAYAGQTTQSFASVAVGTSAGQTTQGGSSVAIGYDAGNDNQGTQSVAVGANAAAAAGQGADSVAVGYSAGNNNQGIQAVSIGSQAGASAQSNRSIAIGYFAANLSQAADSVAIGHNAASGNGVAAKGQGSQSVAIGADAGESGQALNTVAIGYQAGQTDQSTNSVAIGSFAGQTAQGNTAVAIGRDAGFNTQRNDATAVGYQAGRNFQQLRAVAIGSEAGKGSNSTNNQGNDAVAIGFQAATTLQGAGSVAIGREAGKNQGASGVAIGFESGFSNQSDGATAVGYQAGRNFQQLRAVAIGLEAGKGLNSTSNQGNDTVAIGFQAATTLQGVGSVAIGSGAGKDQGASSVAIGFESGFSAQLAEAVALGGRAGRSNQGTGAVAIGYDAGFSAQGTDAIAIGNLAGQISQANSSIVIGPDTASTGVSSVVIGQLTTTAFANTLALNASGAALAPAQASSFYVKPVRNVVGAPMTLNYDPTSGEVSYDAPSSGVNTLYQLSDTDATLQTAEAGTVLVRNAAADTWEKSGLTRIAIGAGTDNTLTTATSSIAVGFGSTGAAHSLGALSSGAIAIGSGAGTAAGAATNNSNAIAIGTSAGASGQALNSIAIGNSAGQNRLQTSKVAIGPFASRDFGSGTTLNGAIDAVVTTIVVTSAANLVDGQVILVESELIQIGTIATNTLNGCTRGFNSTTAASHSTGVAVFGVVSDVYPPSGYTALAGPVNGVAIGLEAGEYDQAASAVAIGQGAGRDYQRGSAVAVGRNAGSFNQGQNSVAIGNNAGQNNTGASAVSIGLNSSAAGTSSLAIGNLASAAFDNTIAFNASGTALAAAQASSFYVKPIRNVTGLTNTLNYDPTTGEIVYDVAGSGGASALYQLTDTDATLQTAEAGTVLVRNAAADTWVKSGLTRIAIGAGTNNTLTTATSSVAIGFTNTGAAHTLGANSAAAIAIGLGAGAAVGGVTNNSGAVAIGEGAGATGQNTRSVAIGYHAGQNNAGANSVAIGTSTGAAGTSSVAIGNLAAATTNGSLVLNASGATLTSAQAGFYAKPVRNVTGLTNTLNYDTTTGEIVYDAAFGGALYDLTDTDATLATAEAGTVLVRNAAADTWVKSGLTRIAIGASTDNTLTTATSSIAVGFVNAGAAHTLGASSAGAIAIGSGAGSVVGTSTNNSNSIAIGTNAGQTSLGASSVAIGDTSAAVGDNSVAIGKLASANVDGSIVLNASGTAVTADQAGLFVDPIRTVTGIGYNYFARYNPFSKEITYNQDSDYAMSADIANLENIQTLYNNVNYTPDTGVFVNDTFSTSAGGYTNMGIVDVPVENSSYIEYEIISGSMNFNANTNTIVGVVDIVLFPTLGAVSNWSSNAQTYGSDGVAFIVAQASPAFSFFMNNGSQFLLTSFNVNLGDTSIGVGTKIQFGYGSGDVEVVFVRPDDTVFFRSRQSTSITNLSTKRFMLSVSEQGATFTVPENISTYKGTLAGITAINRQSVKLSTQPNVGVGTHVLKYDTVSSKVYIDNSIAASTLYALTDTDATLQTAEAGTVLVRNAAADTWEKSGLTRIAIGAGTNNTLTTATSSVAIGFTNTGAAHSLGANSAGAIAIGSGAGVTLSGVANNSNAIAIGTGAGASGQSSNSVVIGNNAGQTNTGTSAIAIGTSATAAGTSSVAIGQLASAATNGSLVLNASGVALASTQAGFYAKPVRNVTGLANALNYDTTTGEIVYDTKIENLYQLADTDATLATAEAGTVLVRNAAADTWVKSGLTRLALGNTTDATLTTATSSVAIGFSNAGAAHTLAALSSGAIAIGSGAGASVGTATNNSNAIAIGTGAGALGQSLNSVAIGNSAGQNKLQTSKVAIGPFASRDFGTGTTLNGGIDAVVTTIVVTSAANFTAGQVILIESELIQIGTIAGNNLNGCTRGFNSTTAASHLTGVAVFGVVSDVYPPSGYTALAGPVNGVAIGLEAGEYDQAAGCVAIGQGAGRDYQRGSAVAIGKNSGAFNQGLNSVAIGNGAGQNNTGASAVSIGLNSSATGTSSVALGQLAAATTAGSIVLNASGAALASTQAGFYAKPIRNVTGLTNTLNYDPTTGEIVYDAASAGVTTLYDLTDTDATLATAEAGTILVRNAAADTWVKSGLTRIAIGNTTDATLTTATGSIAVGFASAGAAHSLGANSAGAIAIGSGAAAATGSATNNSNSIAIGRNAAATGQNNDSVAIGGSAALNSQGNFAVSVGALAGQNQGSSSVAVGYQAGKTGQSTFSVAVGGNAAATSQATQSVAVGYLSGNINQGTRSVAIGYDSASSNQGTNSVALGYRAGATTQGTGAIAIGSSTANNGQGARAIAIGQSSGTTAQGIEAIAIGYSAASSNQQAGAVAVGYTAGQTTQGINSVAIGYQAGNSAQGAGAVAVGLQAGQTAQGASSVAIGESSASAGANSVAIGKLATATTAGSIVLNASGAALTSTQAGFFVDPVRRSTADASFFVRYNPVTKELTRNADVEYPVYGGPDPLEDIQTLYNNANITVNNNAVVDGTHTVSNNVYNNLSIFDVAVSDTKYFEFTVNSGTVDADSAHVYVGLIDTIFYPTRTDISGWGRHVGTFGSNGLTVGMDQTTGNADIKYNSTTTSQALDLNTGVVALATGARVQVGISGNDAEVVFVQSDLTTVVARVKYTSASGFATLSDKRACISTNSTGFSVRASFEPLTYKGTLVGLTSLNVREPKLKFDPQIGVGTHTLKYNTADGKITIDTSSGGVTTLYDLTDTDATLQTAEAGTVLVRNAAADTWEKSGLTRLAIGAGTDNTLTTATNSVAVGFANTGAAHSLGASSAGAIAIGSGAGSVVGTSTNNSNSIAIGTNAGQDSQGNTSVAIGNNTGQYKMGNNAVAIGPGTANNRLANAKVAIGLSAAQNMGVATTLNGGINAVVTTIVVTSAADYVAGQVIQIESELIQIGTIAGNNLNGCTRGFNSTTAASHLTGAVVFGVVSDVYPPANTIAVANGSNAIAIGTSAGRYDQGFNALAIGNGAGRDYQNTGAVAVGFQSGNYSQGNQATAVGYQAGNSSQGASAVAVGYGAGKTTQGLGAVAVGLNAGFTAQGVNAVAIGSGAGQTSQGASAIAIGDTSTSSGSNSIAIGLNASATGTSAVALGDAASSTTTNAVALGNDTSVTGISGVAVGDTAESIGDRSLAAAILASASGTSSVALGDSSQANATDSISIGHGALADDVSSIAVGTSAATAFANSIAIGNLAQTGAPNAIMLNASGTLQSADQSGFHVDPIRNVTVDGMTNLKYNPTTKEIVQTADTSNVFSSSVSALDDIQNLYNNALISTNNNTVTDGTLTISNNVYNNLSIFDVAVTDNSYFEFVVVGGTLTADAVHAYFGIVDTDAFIARSDVSGWGRHVGTFASNGFIGGFDLTTGNMDYRYNGTTSSQALTATLGAIPMEIGARIQVGVSGNDVEIVFVSETLTTVNARATYTGTGFSDLTKKRPCITINQSTTSYRTSESPLTYQGTLTGLSYLNLTAVSSIGYLATSSGGASLLQYDNDTKAVTSVNGTTTGNYMMYDSTSAGWVNRGTNRVALGNSLLSSVDSNSTIAIGFGGTGGAYSLAANASGSTIAIGNQAAVSAGTVTTNAGAIAIGLSAGNTGQNTNCVALGRQAGQNNQGVAAVAIGYSAGTSGQGTNSVCIGIQSGYQNKQSGGVAIGNQAGFTWGGYTTLAAPISDTQTNVTTAAANFAVINDVIAIESEHMLVTGVSGTVLTVTRGYNSTTAATHLNGLVIYKFGDTTYPSTTWSATNAGNGTESVAIGTLAGRRAQGESSTAIGSSAGQDYQGKESIAIGVNAGKNEQGIQCAAIGFGSGSEKQKDQCTSVGYYSGEIRQAVGSTAVGSEAGRYNQPISSTAVGYFAQHDGMSSARLAAAITASDTTISLTTTEGFFAGQRLTRGLEQMTVGTISGNDLVGCTRGTNGTTASSHPANSLIFGALGALVPPTSWIPGGLGSGIAIGSNSGRYNQGYAVSIGSNSGLNFQADNCVSIGHESGKINQGVGATAIGYRAGNDNQAGAAIAIGQDAGKTSQGGAATAIGYNAGQNNQGIGCIAIGNNAGQNNQGSQSIAIGSNAGSTNLPNNCIILNSSGAALNPATTGVYITSIVSDVSTGTLTSWKPPTGFNFLCYNPTTKEIRYFTST